MVLRCCGPAVIWCCRLAVPQCCGQSENGETKNGKGVKSALHACSVNGPSSNGELEADVRKAANQAASDVFVNNRIQLGISSDG